MFLASRNCSALEEITLSNSLTMIDNEVFNCCRSLRQITIPEGVSVVGYKAFNECSSLEIADLPSTLQKISLRPFYKCEKLHSIYCRSVTPPTIIDDWGNTIGETNQDGFPMGDWKGLEYNAPERMIYVPHEAVDSYRSVYGWREYASSIEGYDF